MIGRWVRVDRQFFTLSLWYGMKIMEFTLA